MAVPVTVPEGCVGSVERRVRWKVHGDVGGVRRLVKIWCGRDGGGGVLSGGSVFVDGGAVPFVEMFFLVRSGRTCCVL